jgi:hypothetical protein
VWALLKLLPSVEPAQHKLYSTYRPDLAIAAGAMQGVTHTWLGDVKILCPVGGDAGEVEPYAL